MTRYKHGKIYKLHSKYTDKFYIGSTTKTLQQRLQAHRSDYQQYKEHQKGNYQSSFEILKYKDCRIELLEAYPCTTKSQLRKRKHELLTNHKADIVNKPQRYRTKDPTLFRYSSKLRNIPESDTILDKVVQLAMDNNGLHRNQHVTATLTKPKRRKQAKSPVRVACECGSIVQSRAFKKHLQSKSHKDMMDWFERLQ